MPDALPADCDLLIIGSGAGGMAAAITAHAAGLKPVIIEKTEYFGGSTAVSGGAIWIPDNPLMRAGGMTDDRAAARRYIESETGNRFNGPLVDAFLENGPKAIEFFHTWTALTFTHRVYSPDYHSDRDGAALGGRVIDAEDYDGRRLGARLGDLRPPIRDFVLFGGMMLNRFDIGHMLKMTRSVRSALHAAGLVSRYARDRLTHRRGTRLVLGAAVAGRMGEEVFRRGIPLVLNTRLLSLEQNARGRVTGARLRGPDGEARIATRRGVVLAAGGFPQSADRRGTLFDHVRRGVPHYSMSPTAATGEAISAAEAIGAGFVGTNSNPAFWTPVSLLPNGDGTTRPFPHLFLDRAKPGVIAVGRDGRRFANEAASYHDFVQAMISHLLETGAKSAWLVADHRAVRRYGLGAAPAFPGRLGRHLQSGYLKRAATIADLAHRIGVDAGGLAESVAAMNRDAPDGVDRAMGKGGTAYQTYLGDAAVKPNPCLAPIVTAPFYAVEIFPGDIGTSMGLAVDRHAQVLRKDGTMIEGLYAAGNDMNSIMAGAYPGAGITLGPALTFGWIAGRSAAGQVVQNE